MSTSGQLFEVNPRAVWYWCGWLDRAALEFLGFGFMDRWQILHCCPVVGRWQLPRTADRSPRSARFRSTFHHQQFLKTTGWDDCRSRLQVKNTAGQGPMVDNGPGGQHSPADLQDDMNPVHCLLVIPIYPFSTT